MTAPRDTWKRGRVDVERFLFTSSMAAFWCTHRCLLLTIPPEAPKMKAFFLAYLENQYLF